MHTRVALAILLFSQLISAVNIIYDETGWTKQEWHKYKLEYSPAFEPTPADEVVKSPEIRNAMSKARLNSVDGPLEREAIVKPPGLWFREDGSLVQSPDQDSVEAAAEAMTCTVCHGMVSHVWQQVVHAVNTAEPINEGSVGDMFDEACDENHVPSKILHKYRIVKVDAPEAGVSLFVVRSRPGSSSSSRTAKLLGDSSPAAGRGHPGTEAEVLATQKACKDLVNHHQSLLVKPIWKQANDYFMAQRNMARRMLTKLKSDADDADEYDDPDDDEDVGEQHKALVNLPDSKLLPYEALCLDMELLCPLWASMGECAANPKYMVGTSRKLGHCRASCGRCKPDNSWKEHPFAVKELEATASTLLSVLRNTACTTSKACMSGGGGSTTPGAGVAVQQNADILPGAALAKMEGFVLGKPSWGTPDVQPDPKSSTAAGKGAAAATAAAAVDPADKQLTSEQLGSKHVGIPQWDGFFIYQLEYKKRVYQYHKDSSGKVTEDHVLGIFNKEATAAAEKLHAAAPLNEAGRAWIEQQAALRAEQQKAQDATTDKAKAAGSQQEAGRPSSAAAAGSTSATGPAAAGPDSQAGPDSSRLAGPDSQAGGAQAELPPPMLDLLDYLPDTAAMLKSWWPYMRQMYTDGEQCSGEGGGRSRQVELRVACSPHTTWRLLIREPEFCKYVMVLYHPSLCSLPRYKPVPKTKPAGAAAGATGAAAAAAAAGGDKGINGKSEGNGKFGDKPPTA